MATNMANGLASGPHPDKLTAEQRAERIVSNMIHEAHLRYQKQQLKAQDTTLVSGRRLESPEVRGCKRKPSVAERKTQNFQIHWFTGLRPNFWKGYFETLAYMTK